MTAPVTRSVVHELKDLRIAVRDFVRDEINAGRFTPTVNAWMSSWDEGFSRRLADRGWVGMTIPKEYGGRGASFLERFVVTEELLAAGAPVAAHWVADRQIGPSLLRFGTEEQKRSLLPGIAAGELYFGIGMSEPESGSDLASVRTRAAPVEGGWSITGSKVWTSGAHKAHYFIVLARTAPFDIANRHSGLSQFIVPFDAPGVDVRPIVSLDGSKHFNEVFLQDVFVPDARVMGMLGNGWTQVTAELAFERSGPERYLSTLPLLLSLTTDSDSVDTERGRLTARITSLHDASFQVARALSERQDVDLHAAMIKVLGTETEGEIAEFAALAGAGGALASSALLNRPGFTLRGGTNEVLRGVIARGIGMR